MTASRHNVITKVSNKSTSKNKKVSYNLSEDEIHAGCRERYLTHGYRSENMTIKECLKTPFIYHCNETFNIWTHFIPFLLFAIKFGILFTTELPITDMFYWPLAVNALGIMGFCITSSMAHTFCALSPKARYICFYMDYAIINVYSGTGWQAYYFYGRPIQTPGIFTSENIHLMALIAFKIGVISTFQCCCSRHVKNVLEHLMRVSSFVIPWLCAAFPYLYRLYLCDNDFDCATTSWIPFWTHTVFYVVGALALASKLPERLSPGTFNYIGHSHQIMHLCVAIGGYFQFESIKNEMLGKETVLRQQEINQTYSMHNALFVLLTLISNAAIALYFPNVRKYIFTEEKTIEDASKKEN